MSNARPTAPSGDAARPTSVPPDESDVLVASEERLRVSTRRVPARRARLEKYLVTETHTVTVQLTQEQVRLVYEPISDQAPPAEQAPGGAGATSTDEQGWLTLHREQVQLTTVVVPVERVRLDTYQVTEQQQVTEDVRRERIDTEAGLVDAPDPAAD